MGIGTVIVTAFLHFKVFPKYVDLGSKEHLIFTVVAAFVITFCEKLFDSVFFPYLYQTFGI